METKRRVVLYGDTLVLAAVGRALSARGELCVTSLDPTRTTAIEDLDSMRPCVVILDLSAVSPESAVALVRGRPDLLLIGLEPAGDRLLVLSREQAHALTTDDLVRLIDAGVSLASGASEPAGECSPHMPDVAR